MKLYRVFFMVCTALLLAACSNIFGGQTDGSGKIITEKRVVAEFSSLELRCSADVSLVQGDQVAVSVEGEDNIVPLIHTTVSDYTLTIDVKWNTSFRTTKPLIVHVTAPIINSVRVTGNGDVEMGEWTIDSLEITTTGSGGINIARLDMYSLTSRLTGSGNILIKGGVGGNQVITTSGSGDFEAGAMESREVKATSTGSGGITVWVTRNLSATTSGSGDIRYYGSPKVTKNSTGSGSVDKRGDHP